MIRAALFCDRRVIYMAEYVQAKVGTAGWNIPLAFRLGSNPKASLLENYGLQFNAVEINSSFYRPHKFSTYAKWASLVPEGFSFSVKLPKTITHDSRLVNVDERLNVFAEQVLGLGNKLGCLLVQLPPSLKFSQSDAKPTFQKLQQIFSCPIVCEPRHLTWFSSDTDNFLKDSGVSRVAADPAICIDAAKPGGDLATCYYRLHGSPEKYFSDYNDIDIQNYANLIRKNKTCSQMWCIFDNTGNGRATPNALTLKQFLNVATFSQKKL
jgi:uncharacterized protein YecE (DUF72 family)